MATDGGPADPPDIEDALDELAELEELVDAPAEREQVRETMRVLRRARQPRLLGRVRGAFDLRDAGEALVGSVIFGIPMIVEDGTLDVGEAIAATPVYLVLTLAFGLALVLGVLHAARFEEVEADLLAGVVPRRLVGILAIAGGTATFLMTVWARVDWGEPWVATCQVAVTAVVMALGASLGDILPE